MQLERTQRKDANTRDGAAGERINVAQDATALHRRRKSLRVHTRQPHVHAHAREHYQGLCANQEATQWCCTAGCTARAAAQHLASPQEALLYCLNGMHSHCTSGEHLCSPTMMRLVRFEGKPCW